MWPPNRRGRPRGAAPTRGNGMTNRVELFIDGRWRAGSGGAREIFDPATEQAIGEVSLAGLGELDEALVAAERSLAAWRDVPALERGAILSRVAALIRERTPDIARILTAEQGKTLAESRGELGRAAETFAWNGEEAARVEGRIIQGRAKGQQRFVVPEPMGVVGAFTAWNFPAVLISRKLGAA